MRRLSILLLTLPLVVTGCGKEPPAAPTCAPPAPLRTFAPLPPQGPGAQPGALPGPPPGGQPAALIAAAIAAARALPAYELEMRWEQKQGARRTQGIYSVAGQAPRTTRIVIKSGESEGTRVLYQGGTTARVRLAGLLGAVALDLPVDDERLRSVRGYTIAQTDLPAFLTLLGDPRHRTVALGEAAAGPRIGLAGGPLLPGCVRAEAILDRQSGLPAQLAFYDAREVVYRIELRNFRAARHTTLEI